MHRSDLERRFDCQRAATTAPTCDPTSSEVTSGLHRGPPKEPLTRPPTEAPPRYIFAMSPNLSTGRVDKSDTGELLSPGLERRRPRSILSGRRICFGERSRASPGLVRDAPRPPDDRLSRAPVDTVARGSHAHSIKLYSVSNKSFLHGNEGLQTDGGHFFCWRE